MLSEPLFGKMLHGSMILKVYLLIIKVCEEEKELENINSALEAHGNAHKILLFIYFHCIILQNLSLDNSFCLSVCVCACVLCVCMCMYVVCIVFCVVCVYMHVYCVFCAVSLCTYAYVCLLSRILLKSYFTWHFSIILCCKNIHLFQEFSVITFLQW